MEAALKRALHDKAGLVEENKSMFGKLQESSALYFECKRAHSSAEEELTRLRKKYDKMKRKCASHKEESDRLSGDSLAWTGEREGLLRRVHDSERAMDAQERERRAEESMAALVLAKAEKELAYRDEQVAALREEVQRGKAELSEYVSSKEFLRLSDQYEKLSQHCRSNTVPIEQHNSTLAELSRLQGVLSESVSKRELNSLLAENESLRERQHTSMVPKERFDALEAVYATFKTKVAGESVPLERWNELVASSKNLSRQMQTEYVEVHRFERLEAMLEASVSDNRLIESAAKVLEEERDLVSAQLSERSRELASMHSKQVDRDKEYSALNSLVHESNSVIENLRVEVDGLQGQLSASTRRTCQLETDKASLAVQLGNCKLRAKQAEEARAGLQRSLDQLHSERRQLVGDIEVLETRRIEGEERARSLEGVLSEYKAIVSTWAAVPDHERGSKVTEQVTQQTQPDVEDALSVQMSMALSPVRPLHLSGGDFTAASFAVDGGSPFTASRHIKSLDERLKDYQETLGNKSGDDGFSVLF